MSRKSDFLAELHKLVTKYGNKTHDAEFYIDSDGGEAVISIYIPEGLSEPSYDFIYNSEEVS